MSTQNLLDLVTGLTFFPWKINHYHFSRSLSGGPNAAHLEMDGKSLDIDIYSNVIDLRYGEYKYGVYHRIALKIYHYNGSTWPTKFLEDLKFFLMDIGYSTDYFVSRFSICPESPSSTTDPTQSSAMKELMQGFKSFSIPK